MLFWESGFVISPYFALFTFGYFNSLACVDQYIECEFNGIYSVLEILHLHHENFWFNLYSSIH